MTHPSPAAHDILHRGLLLELLNQWGGVMWPGRGVACLFFVCRSRLSKAPTGYYSTYVGRHALSVLYWYVQYLYCRVLYGYPSVHGAVFRTRKSYGPVRCGFTKSEILRRGSVRFPRIRNLAAWFGAVIYPTVWFGAIFKQIGNPAVRLGAVLKNRKPYGAVRCDFQKSVILRCDSVRFSDIANPTVRFGAVSTNQKSYAAVRAVPRWTVFLRCGSTLRGKKTYNAAFSLRCTAF